QVESTRADAGAAHAINLSQGFIFDAARFKLLLWHPNVQTQALHRRPGLRSLNTEQSVMRGGVDNLHIVGDDEFTETIRNGCAETWFEVEQDFVREDVNVQ